MLQYLSPEPVAITLGPIQIHWYGILYLLGFSLCYWDCKRRRQLERLPWEKEQILDAFSYLAAGIILGGRVLYLLLYQPEFIQHPLELFYIWLPGRSFHGALLGGLVGAYLYSRKNNHGFWQTLDFIAPSVPLGIFCGRIGNFINGELWGRVSTLPWSMSFPAAGPEARHPSQLYEALGEGLLLYFLLRLFARHTLKGFRSGAFLCLYGVMRFSIEFFREPDRLIEFLAFDWLTMGQALCIPMILVGMVLMGKNDEKLS